MILCCVVLGCDLGGSHVLTPCSFPCPCRIIAYSFTVSFHFAAPLAFIMQEFSETTAPTVAPPTRSGDSDAQACRQRNERKVSEFSLEPWGEGWTVLAGGGGGEPKIFFMCAGVYPQGCGLVRADRPPGMWVCGCAGVRACFLLFCRHLTGALDQRHASVLVRQEDHAVLRLPGHDSSAGLARPSVVVLDPASSMYVIQVCCKLSFIVTVACFMVCVMNLPCLAICS